MNGDGDRGGARPQGRGWRTYAALAIALLALVVILQNTDDTQIKFLFAETEMPLFFALIVAVALGAAIGWLTPRVRRGRKPPEQR
jgi:uncharacterized integral membrane protein